MTEQATPVDDDSVPNDDALQALASLPEFHHPVAAPDGDEIAYYYDGSGRNELYVRDVETGDETRISDGNVPRDARYPVIWDAGGDRLFFHRDTAGDEQTDVYAITRDGDTGPVIETEGQTLLWDVAADGETLLYSTTAGGQVNLYAYDVESGGETQLTEYDRPARFGRLSPDGDRITFQTNERDDLANKDAYVMHSDGSGKRRLDVGSDGSETVVESWLPDGNRLLVGDDSADKNRCGIYDLETDRVTWYGSGDYVERPEYVLPDGDGFLATRSRECARIPVYYDIDDPESGRELDVPDGVARLPDGPQCNGVLADGRILVTLSTPARRAELYAYDLQTDERETLIAAEYGAFDPADFVEAEVVTYESADGLEIRGLLYESGARPSPAVVAVHGGPHAADVKRFDSRVQFLVDSGYTVFKPNYRGSTGRGREFKTRIHGDWGGMEQEDVAAAGRWLADRDWIDSDRVAVFGTSYGGYSTYMQLVQYPSLWAIGVAHVGMTDLPQLYEDSMPHFQTGLEMHVGDPEADAERYRERSPITHVEEMTAPVLMVHGKNDPRCPVSQARRFKAALEDSGWEAGTDFEYEELGDEGHGSTDIDHKIRTYRLMADFFDRRL